MKIVIPKLPRVYVKVLQLKLYEYFNFIHTNLKDDDYNQYCQNLVLFETVYTLINTINKKLDSTQEKHTLKLAITQAVVLQSACNFETTSDKIEEKGIFKNISDQVHQQIKSIIL